MLVVGDLYVVLSPERLGPALEEVSYEPSHDAVHDLWQACEDVLAMQVVRSTSCSATDTLTQHDVGRSAFPHCAVYGAGALKAVLVRKVSNRSTA